MLKNLLNGRDDVLWGNGDEQDIHNIFENTSSTMLKTIIGKKSFIVIKKAQAPLLHAPTTSCKRDVCAFHIISHSHCNSTRAVFP